MVVIKISVVSLKGFQPKTLDKYNYLISIDNRRTFLFLCIKSLNIGILRHSLVFRHPSSISKPQVT